MKLYTSKAVSEWLGLTERRIRQLRDEGIIAEERPGLYDLKPTVLRYINYLRGQGITSLQTEKTRLTAAKREAAEMDNEERRGDIHTTEDVKRGLKTICLNIRGRMLVLPAKLSAKIATMNGKQSEIFDLLKDEIEGALEELSRAEYIVAGEVRADGEENDEYETGEKAEGGSDE